MADDLALFKEEVKNRVDIADVIGEYVDLRRKGASIMGLCPFHAEKSPSFNVNRDGQFYHCFGCGKGGDVFSFLMDITGMSFMEALEHLSERTGLDMPKKRGFDKNAKDLADRVAAANLAAAEYFHRMLSATEGERGMTYLRDRGLEPATIRAFRLGFAPEDPAGLVAFAKTKSLDIDALDAAGILLKSKYGGPPYGRFGNRIIFPIIDQAARVLGFGGRILEGEGAKYVNSPETRCTTKAGFSSASISRGSHSRRSARPSWSKATWTSSRSTRRVYKTCSPRPAPRSPRTRDASSPVRRAR